MYTIRNHKIYQSSYFGILMHCSTVSVTVAVNLNDIDVCVEIYRIVQIVNNILTSETELDTFMITFGTLGPDTHHD